METFEPRRILCPTDFSDLAALALRYAKLIVDGFSSRLTVLYADPFLPPPHFTAGQMDDLVRAIKQSKGAAKEALIRHVHDQIGGQEDFDALVFEGQTVSAILETAGKMKADLIVMGTHGRSGVNRFMLGSVTERILHETDRPVLTVRREPAETGPGSVLIRKVLCPTNYTETALKALTHAVAISAKFGAEMLVVHVVESRSADLEKDEEHDRLCAWIPQDVRARCSLREIVRQGDAAEQIIETAREDSCDLIALGARHKRFSETTVLGTTTVNVTRFASCPVLTVVHT